MSAPDREWTHLTDVQARGAACVMCGRSTRVGGWTGVPVGRAEDGTEVVACAPAGRPGTIGDGRARIAPTCADQAGQTVPDHFE